VKKLAKRALAGLLAVVMCVSLLTLGASAETKTVFTDVPSTAWYAGNVAYVYENGLMNGTSATTFEPSASLTRAMFVTILGRLDGVDTSAYGGTSFTDVATGKWYSAYVAWASANGIVNGYSATTFGTNDPVTREQMATIIARYVDYAGVTLPQAESIVASFQDASSVSSWAREGLELMRTTGIITGYTDGTFGPKKTAMRMEAATVFTRLDQAIDSVKEKSAAEQYYETYSDLIDVIDVETSGDVPTEADVKSLLEARGFEDYSVTYEYTMDGEYIDETEISEESTNKYPMYQTFYLSENGEGWAIYVINGEVFANPVSFNLESDLDAPLLVSASKELTSYDAETNKYYVTIPYASEVIVELVDTIDAETLDNLTIEKICELTGATLPDLDDEDENEDSIATASLVDSDVYAPVAASANGDDDDPIIVVSLGDSYSSGEGIEKFYGQDKSLSERIEDEDWLAHRSTLSWPGLLKIPGVAGTMSDYKVDVGSTGTGSVQWYFGAVSGAKTKNFKQIGGKNTQQIITYNKGFWSGLGRYYLSGSKVMPYQLDVFNDIQGKVDYVTLTIGGNDVDFAGVITKCVMESSYLETAIETEALGAPLLGTGLERKLYNLWKNVDETMAKIKRVYENIEEAAGKQAAIIVAGYPQLLDKNGKGAAISKQEATEVNKKVSAFNDKIEALVAECRASGMNIYFVDVEDEFDGHQAYSSNAWINKIYFGTKSQDTNELAVASSYSVHPNKKGAEAYARCVNAKIAEIEGDVRINYYEVFSNVAASWEAAELYCESLGGHLATISSKKENDYIYQLMRDAGYKSAYFGMTNKDADGTWTWVNNETWSYTNWHSGEPNQQNGTENYAMFYYKFTDGTWNDGDFGGSTVNGEMNFICEWDTESAYNAYLAKK
jgi:lysophospholipase L1-like esterase